jgi:hypothetical protein
MVGGTENILDAILKDERRFGFKHANVVTIEVTTTPDLLLRAHAFHLVEKCQWDGAYYLHTRSKKTVWFCDVLKYVMGEFPETMYYRHVIEQSNVYLSTISFFKLLGIINSHQ